MELPFGEVGKAVRRAGSGERSGAPFFYILNLMCQTFKWGFFFFLLQVDVRSQIPDQTGDWTSIAVVKMPNPNYWTNRELPKWGHLISGLCESGVWAQCLGSILKFENHWRIPVFKAMRLYEVIRIVSVGKKRKGRTRKGGWDGTTREIEGVLFVLTFAK